MKIMDFAPSKLSEKLRALAGIETVLDRPVPGGGEIVLDPDLVFELAQLLDAARHMIKLRAQNHPAALTRQQAQAWLNAMDALADKATVAD